MRNLAWMGFLIAGIAQTAAASGYSDNSRPVPSFVRPVGPKPVRDEVKPPYPMNYTDEAAQTLGFHDGRWDLFSSQPPANNALMPALSGGISGNGAMLRLQWRQGQ